MMENKKVTYSLPLRERFCDGQIVCRFLRPLRPTETVILAIPGGPGLSSRYLDAFMCSLSERTGANVATMDLPNHGESKVKTGESLSYPECLHFVRQTVAELQQHTKNLIVFGQSMGARLAFDLLADLKMGPSATLLTGFPYIFQVSSGLISRLNDLPLQSEEGPDAEKIHEENWKIILPIYSVKPLSDETFAALATREKLPNAHNMLQDTSPIETVAARIPKESSILIIEAPEDPVVPDNNWTILRGLIPGAIFTRMEAVGHFPMAENPDAVAQVFSDFIRDGVH